MNWQKIEEKYPLSCDLLFQWRTVLIDRDLYDFFDNNGVIIQLWFNSYRRMYPEFFWNYEINNFQAKGNFKYKTRKKAENKAFLEAFKILEKKLKDK